MKLDQSYEALRNKFGRALPSSEPHQCFCTGPQNGDPLCRCAMRDVTVRDGRYVRIQDLGPAPRQALRDRVKAFNA